MATNDAREHTMELRTLLRRGRDCATWTRLLPLALCAALLAPTGALGKNILVIGPHPDDESLVSAGVTRRAVSNGDSVKVVIVTNGDAAGGTATGLARQVEAVGAAQALGIAESDVIFLGYPDGSMRRIYDASNPTQVFTSAAGQTATYGNRGLGGMDFHRYLTGSPGPYNHATVLSDFQALLTRYSPDEIYTTTHFDNHGDHQAVGLFVVEAIVGLKRAGSLLSTRLFQSFVWAPDGSTWPDPSGVGACDPTLPFTMPPKWADVTQLDWNTITRMPVPAEMQVAGAANNLKCIAIGRYTSQLGLGLYAWARKDEIFFVTDFGTNLAASAQVSASSDAAGLGGARATDGVIDGGYHDPVPEWVTQRQKAGAWIQLDWAQPVRVAQVNLFDRPDWAENILSGTLSFSDGSSIAVGELPAGGTLLPLTFAPRTVSWVRFTVTAADGTATGLSEIQVLGKPASSTANVPPHFITGPVASAGSIRSSQTAVFTVVANDVDGDAVQYLWSADGGSVAGNGASAVFTPPPVAVSTVFTITSQILDGRGGASTNAGFITVTPANNGLSVTPAVVVSGAGAVGTVALAVPAPAGGTSIPLLSSSPVVASVPAAVVVPAGAVSATFNVVTGTVAVDTAVTVTATIGGNPYAANLTVSPVAPPPPPPPPPTGNLLQSPNAIGTPPWENWGNVATTSGFGIAPDGSQTASRSVVSAGGGHALVQPDVAVSASTVYVLSFYAKNNGGTAASYSVYDVSHDSDIISPTGYVSRIDGTSWTQISVPFTTPVGCTSINVYLLRDSGSPVDVLLWGASLVPYAPPAADSISVTPASVVSGATATGTVVLASAAPAGGLSFALASSDPGAASVPSAVSIPAGATTATFAVIALPVAAPTTVVITAGFAGGPATASLTVSPILVTGLAFSPSTLIGGGTVQGTVTLNAAAGPQGVPVQLSTTAPTLVGLPAGVVIPAGSASTTFPVSTAAVSATTPVTVTASDGIASATATLTLNPLMVTGLSLSPASVLGGASSLATVSLNGMAPFGGASIGLASGDPSVAGVPTSVTVASGTSTATFTVTTAPVAVSTAVTVSATYGGATRTAALTVSAPALSTLALAVPSAVGGGTVTGSVSLAGPAPVSGVVVSLSSSNTAAATVPASVTIPAGATSATFTIAAAPVTAGASATITASAGGVNRTATLAVRALSLSRSPTTVVGGAASTGTVRLSAAVTAPVEVALASANAGVASVPGSVTIAAGATTATFTIGTVPVAATTAVSISATYGTAVRSVSLTVQAVTASSVALNPTSVPGGAASTGTVTVSVAAPAGGTVVTLASSATAAATVPAQVIVPAGARTATFTITTVPVTANTSSSITATTGGVTRSATLTVRAPRASMLTLAPATVTSGATSTGTVTLDGAAATGGRTVTLRSSLTTVATVPSSVVVPAGATSATFTVTARTVGAVSTTSISAAAGGVTQLSTLTVNP